MPGRDQFDLVDVLDIDHGLDDLAEVQLLNLAGDTNRLVKKICRDIRNIDGGERFACCGRETYEEATVFFQSFVE